MRHAGALSSTWVSAGELLSGISYILTGCLFFKHFSLPQSHVTGVHSHDPRRSWHGQSEKHGALHLIMLAMSALLQAAEIDPGSSCTCNDVVKVTYAYAVPPLHCV